ncbi:MAG: ribosomal protein S18-alanine N-acetyltransferase [Deltaproteobacteria bacterium]|nr:MAG: ribosomal protein S18-alanine N-acetyltransferase [Deltaproteobacteria bacterium]
MSEPLTVVKMTEKDLPEVLAIEQASFPMPFSENMFRTELLLDVASLWVVKIEERVAGYLDYWKVADEMHVITIAVHQEFKRKNIASKLLEHMIHDARHRKVSFISLDVRVSNTPALHLYNKYGFSADGG